MADFIKVGYGTPPVAIFKSESHKLHHAFPLATGKTVVQGQPVVLLNDGTVKGFESGDDLGRVIGFAVTNSANPAYQPSRQHGPVDITVAVSGHGIIHAISGAALNAGPIKPTGELDSTGKYVEYIQAVGAVDGSITPGSFTAPDTYVSPEYTPGVPADRVVALALNPAGDAGELLQVLIL